MNANATTGTLLLITVLVSGAGACSADDGPPAPAPPPSADVSSTNPPGDVGNVTLHRLNASEYDNTVRDLLGDASHPAAAFPPDDGAGSFTNNADALTVSPLLFERYEEAAEKLATGAAANPKIVTCAASATDTDSCARQILAPFLRRAWRRPVTDQEVSGLASLVGVATREGEPFVQGIQLAIKATLLSPHFLFRVEVDPDRMSSTPHRLSDYELANRLSYFVWSSMPDDALLASAESGTWASNPQELDAQLNRMLDDPKARALLDNFAAQWLIHTLPDAKPDATAFTDFDESLRAAMTDETKTFVGSFLLGDESLPDMLDAPYTFLNARLAAHYGIAGVTGTELVRVTVGPETHRGGLLSHASMLTMTAVATRTSPVRRGQWVLAELLCAAPPPPPADVPELPSTITAGTMRQIMEQHRASPSCAGCHTSMDPIGFALEHYDAVGRWRDADHGQPIDSAGVLPDGRAFDGAPSLAAVIKGDPRFGECATKKLFSYALGRSPRAIDGPRIVALARGFADARNRARALIISLVHNDAFRMRRGGDLE